MSALIYFDTAGHFRQLSTPRFRSLIVTSLKWQKATLMAMSEEMQSCEKLPKY